jgi:IS30 family transposase
VAAGWSDEDSRRLTELHAEGKSLHFIAGEIGRSKQTVSRYAKSLGLEWDRATTAKAAEAVHVDNKARRARIEERLLAKGEEFLDQLDEPVIVFSFGGPLNEYAEHELTKPDPVSQKHIVQALATALTAANKLHEMNAGQQAEKAVSALVQMQGALEQFAAQYEAEQQGE